MADRLNYSNRGATTLVGGISESDLTLTVADATVFPDVPFLITIDTEIIKVGYKNEDTGALGDLVRAQEGTSALSHTDGAVVENRITQGTLNQLATSEEARAAIDLPLRAEVVSSFPTRDNGSVIYHTGEERFYGRIDGEWL